MRNDKKTFDTQVNSEGIEKRLHEIIRIISPCHRRSVQIVRVFIFQICSRVVPSFLLLQNHHKFLCQSEKVTAKEIKKLKYYFDEMIKEYQSTLNDSAQSKRMCFLIAYIWMQLLKEEEQSAKYRLDDIWRSLSMQLQEDLVNIALEHSCEDTKKLTENEKCEFRMESNGEWIYELPLPAFYQLPAII